MKILVNIFSALFLLFPMVSSADTYPVNKNIDVKHYAFELSLSDNSNEIIGTTHIAVSF